jgi:hypothetical protein
MISNYLHFGSVEITAVISIYIIFAGSGGSLLAFQLLLTHFWRSPPTTNCRRGPASAS